MITKENMDVQVTELWHVRKGLRHNFISGYTQTTF